jgi:hypothetical protein
MFRRRDRARSIGRLRFGRRPRIGEDVRDQPSGGRYEAQLLDRKERGEREHNADKMVERERWDLLE